MGLRVAHIIGSLGIGGAERNLVNLLNAMDCEFKAVICLGQVPAGHSFRSDLDPGVEQRFLPVRLRGLPCGIWRVAAVLKSMRVNVVHTHMFEPNLFGAMAARLAGVPVVVTSEHGENPWKKWFHRWLERWVISPLVDIRLCVSDQILARRRDLDGVPAEKLVMMVNGTKVPARSPQRSPSSVPVIGAVGRFITAKGYPHLLEAVGELRRRGYQFKVCLVGDGPEMGHIREVIGRLQLEGAVSLPGLVPDVDRWYERFDIYVSSSIREGQPVAQLEAMAHGLPVVATDVGASAKTLRHGREGLIVPSGDPLALANAIADLLDDPERWAAYGARARARVEKDYSVKAVAEYHLKIYNDILER